MTTSNLNWNPLWQPYFKAQIDLWSDLGEKALCGVSKISDLSIYEMNKSLNSTLGTVQKLVSNESNIASTVPNLDGYMTGADPAIYCHEVMGIIWRTYTETFSRVFREFESAGAAFEDLRVGIVPTQPLISQTPEALRPEKAGHPTGSVARGSKLPRKTAPPAKVVVLPLVEEIAKNVFRPNSRMKT